MNNKSMIKTAFLLGVFSFGVVLLPTGVLADERLNITVSPFVINPQVTFDPDRPTGAPAGSNGLPGPPSQLETGEDGVTTTNTPVDFDFSLDANGNVTSVNVTVEGSATVYVPDDAGRNLIDHEEGHAGLAEDVYNLEAAQIVEEAFAGFADMQFPDEASAEAEGNRRVDRIRSAFRGKGDLFTGGAITALFRKYDKLTERGTSSEVNAEQGVQEAWKERNLIREIKWRSGNITLDPMQPQSGIIDPMSIAYDSNNDLLLFDGDRLLDDALDPFDTILGRGRVDLEAMSIVGVQADGSIHLADTFIQITDTQTDDILLDAILYNITYRESNLPGYADMFVAGIDIPPDFAGGIHNSIGSDFLGGLELDLAAGLLPTFQYHPKAAVFNSFGDVIVPNDGVTGRLVFGFPVPEPSTITLILLGLAGLDLTRRRLKQA